MGNVSFSWDNDDSELKKLQQNIDELNRETEIRVADLLTDNFVRQHSNFQSLNDLINASGIKNTEDIGNESFSKFISTHTNFANWEEMVKVATAEYVKRKLGD